MKHFEGLNLNRFNKLSQRGVMLTPVADERQASWSLMVLPAMLLEIF